MTRYLQVATACLCAVVAGCADTPSNNMAEESAESQCPAGQSKVCIGSGSSRVAPDDMSCYCQAAGTPKVPF